VNAAFAYFRPRDRNRFNGPDRGTWYATLATETSLSEVAFHMRRELLRVNDYYATVEYVEMWASFAGNFTDLRTVTPPRRIACIPMRTLAIPSVTSWPTRPWVRA
jgi:hypothetical protein